MTTDRGSRGVRPRGVTGAPGAPGERGKTGYLMGKAVLIRDLWLLLVTIAVLAALAVGRNNVKEVQSGRRTGTAITCVITSAVLQGSHSFIITSASVPLPPKLEKALVAQGYPPLSQRKATATKTADEYTAAVERRVEQAAKAAKGLIGKDGAVNCALLRRITKAS